MQRFSVIGDREGFLNAGMVRYASFLVYGWLIPIRDGDALG